jgi:glyceraldehyde-3-phosphate dehydrogenase (NADP+)
MKSFFKEIHDGKDIPTYKVFLGERWGFSGSDHSNDIVSPIEGKVLGRTEVVTKKEIDKAVGAAKEAQPKWENTSLNTRVTSLKLVADYLREYSDELGGILAEEIGKPLAGAVKEYTRSAQMIDAFIGEIRGLRGEEVESDQFPGGEPGKTAHIKRVARGVILAIAPFNYPINLAVSKIAPALLTGNAVVFKPPTQGSISGAHLAEVFLKAGLPEGVLTFVTGSGSQIGDYLTSRPGISMVAFTGSSQAGEKICGTTGLSNCLFECGGNNPLIVLGDANLELAVEHIAKGAFSYSGQRCTAVKYVLALESTIEKLVPRVVEYTKNNFKLGNPLEKGVNLGPVISEKAAHIIMGRINGAKRAGAQVVLGGEKEGGYIQPTILKNVTADMEIVRIETFGPVVSFIKVEDIGEAVEIINNSNYGLQASVFTEDEGAGISLADRINVGTVQINSNPQRGPDNFPFLGVKSSGLGVQGVRYSLEAMTRLKSTVINFPR